MQKEFQTFLKTVNFLINSSPISHFAILAAIKLTTVFGAGNETRTRDPHVGNVMHDPIATFHNQIVTSIIL